MRLLLILTPILLAAGLHHSAAARPADTTEITTNDGATQTAMAGDKERSTRGKWARESGPPKPKKPEKFKPWSKVLKDVEKLEGLFDVYTKDEDLYFAIKEDQLDKPMANFMNISKGIGDRFILGGMPLGILETVVVDFHREKDIVQLRRLNPRYTAGDDPALAEAIDLSYGNSILASLKIASEKDGAVLVKMNSVFLSDVSDVGWWVQQGVGPSRMDPKKSQYGLVEAFPENIEIEALLTFSPISRRGLSLPTVPDPRYIEIGVRYSLCMLPEQPAKPRIADDRLGYYMSPHKDFSRDGQEDFFVHYINHWRLEKKDPDAALSEPKQPIIYYVDTTVPERFRPYVKQGIEMWQPAFEEAGFKNAIIAKDPADEPEYNAEDARFNTIRWITSDGVAFNAIGPHRTDPRSGEILESDILIEANAVAGYRRGYRYYAGPTEFLDRDPSMMFLKDPAEHPEVARTMEMHRRLGFGCDMAYGFASGFEMGQLAFLMDGMETPEEYIGAAIARVTAHEVGHGLGLRHNFKSSTAVPYEGLNDRELMEEIGQMGSVMDYATPNVSRDRSKQGHYWTPTVGTYDRWVIKWGYTPFSGGLTPEEEHYKLQKIAAQAYEKGHRYGTDEDTYPAGALDPDCMTWDLSDQPLKWAEERIGVCKDILGNDSFVDRVVSDNSSFFPLRNAVQSLLVQQYYAGSRAVRYIGGQRTARPHRGADNNQTALMPVSADEQREAMKFLTKHVLAKDAFVVSPKLLNMLQDYKMRNWRNSPWGYGKRFDFPLTNWVDALQGAVLYQLLHPMRLQRMVDAEYKQSDAFPLSELMRNLTDTIWLNNMVASGNTAIMQRNLQTRYVRFLIMMTLPRAAGSMIPGEATSLARLQMSRIGERIDRAYRQAGLSDEANAHLAVVKAQIDRALNPEMRSSH
jgi:hypothetical protein